jgi:hypothetical protein
VVEVVQPKTTMLETLADLAVVVLMSVEQVEQARQIKEVLAVLVLQVLLVVELLVEVEVVHLQRAHLHQTLTTEELVAQV